MSHLFLFNLRHANLLLSLMHVGSALLALVLCAIHIVSAAIDPASIAILVIADEASLAHRLKANVDSMQCLCKLHGYTLHPIAVSFRSDPTPHSECSHLSVFHFRKQCEVYHFLLDHPDVDWAVVLDADVVVVNPVDHKIEDFLGNHVQDLIFCMRFHNNEVTSGLYIVRNTEYGRLFVKEWYILDDDRATKYGGYNADNGALHWLLLSRLASDSDSKRKCFELGHSATWEDDGKVYPSFIACVHQHFAASKCRGSQWHHVLILPHRYGGRK